MIVSLIVAYDKKRGIGKSNKLPWHLTSDLQRFKKLTTGHYLIMGRKTWEAIGRPLPGRNSIVISRNREFLPEDCIVTHSLEDALTAAKTKGEEEVFIIGGSEVFTQAIEKVDCIYLTEVQSHADADVFFPNLDYRKWKLIHSSFHKKGDKDQYDYIFKVFVRGNSKFLGLIESRFNDGTPLNT